MGYYLDTRGLAVISVGICGRCARKFPSVDLEPDSNSPGLMVCREDRDDLDPYRLPPRETEDITLLFVRSDEPLVITVVPGSPIVTSLVTDSDGNFITDSSGNYITGNG